MKQQHGLGSDVEAYGSSLGLTIAKGSSEDSELALSYLRRRFEGDDATMFGQALGLLPYVGGDRIRRGKGDRALKRKVRAPGEMAVPTTSLTAAFDFKGEK